MGIVSWLREKLAPRQLTAGNPIVRERPLHEQFQRIGGGLTPADVSRIMAMADAGQPERLYDLANEGRQKDGHIQSVCSTREGAVALTNVEFIGPEDGRRIDQKAVKVCQRIVDEFDNWSTLVEHLTSAFFFGHGTAEILWRRTKDGLLLPYRAEPVPQREFIFARSNGSLRYRQSALDLEGVDLLAENPGRIVQVQRRIVGDVPAREGLVRILSWSALFRNWAFRDWIALAEIGWKPWRRGKYKQGTPQGDIDALTRALEDIGSTGVGVFPDNTDMTVDWPTNQSTTKQGAHLELFDTVGRECSKAVLGQTTSVEAGPNGDRAATQTRDRIRHDVRERDAVANAAVLRQQLFSIAVALNVGESAVVPICRFQTDESVDQVAFSQAVKNMTEANVPIPVSWARGEIGAPEPKEGEEVTVAMSNEDDDGDDGDEPEETPPDEDEDDEEEAA